MKVVYKTKQIWINGELHLENISNYIKKYFNDNNLCIVPDTIKGFYNFQIGCKKFDDKINEINKKYKLISDEGYWKFLGE